MTQFIKQYVYFSLGVLQDWFRKTDSKLGATKGAVRNRWNTGHGTKLAEREQSPLDNAHFWWNPKGEAHTGEEIGKQKLYR